MSEHVTSVRWLRQDGNTYMRVEDVVELIQDMSEGEETDVKDRLYNLCENILKTRRKVESIVL